VSVSFDGRDWHATIDSRTFPIGRRVSYRQRRGLTNQYWRSGSAAFMPENHESMHGHWVWILQPGAHCESEGRFNSLNTYDRARMTFGFYQFAAHTPNENFVLLLRRLLVLDSATSYFPDLLLQDGRIARVSDHAPAPLETADSTAALQSYFNPGEQDVEEIEAIQAAKLIHWSMLPQHQAVQVETAIEKLKNAMPAYSRRYGLDGRSDSVCTVVADIRHQGRASSSEIMAALDTADDEGALAALLEIGDHAYPERIRTLNSEIHRLTAAGILGRRRYDAGRNDLI
jgi:hypothetical protein